MVIRAAKYAIDEIANPLRVDPSPEVFQVVLERRLIAWRQFFGGFGFTLWHVITSK
jgi:hypothetical protein